MKKQISSSSSFLVISILLMAAVGVCYYVWLVNGREEIKTVSGESFYLSLPLNSKEECGWEARYNRSYLQLTDEECLPESENFTFFALRPGKTSLIFSQSDETKKYIVKILP